MIDGFDDNKCSCFWNKLQYLIRFTGITNAIVLFGVGVDIAVHHYVFGEVIIIISILTFFLETTWIVKLFLDLCDRDDSSCLSQCWDAVLWLDLWKKSILYTLFAFLLFLRPHRLWLSVVSGFLLMLLAAFYFGLTFRHQKDSKFKPNGNIINARSPLTTCSYDRFDDITDLLDDSMPGAEDNLSELGDHEVIEM